MNFGIVENMIIIKPKPKKYIINFIYSAGLVALCSCLLRGSFKIQNDVYIVLSVLAFVVLLIVVTLARRSNRIIFDGGTLVYHGGFSRKRIDISNIKKIVRDRPSFGQRKMSEDAYQMYIVYETSGNGERQIGLNEVAFTKEQLQKIAKEIYIVNNNVEIDPYYIN